MIKTLAYIGTILFLGLWAWPAQAGCNCSTQYQRTYYVPQYQTRTYRTSYPVNGFSNYNPNYDPIIGNWYGVNNTQQISNPFGDWYGVNNMSSTDPNNPFGDWYGVNNTGNTSNPFSDWYGVNNSGTTYQPGTYYAPNQYAVAPTQYGASLYQNNNSNAPTNNYFVAPKTGVNKYAPFGFAGLITAGLFVVKKRKWLFT